MYETPYYLKHASSSINSSSKLNGNGEQIITYRYLPQYRMK